MADTSLDANRRRLGSRCPSHGTFARITGVEHESDHDRGRINDRGGRNEKRGFNISDHQRQIAPWISAVRSVADRYEAEWIAIRRHLHRHPELSGNEHKTTEYVAEAVVALGLAPDLKFDGTGLTVDLVTDPDLSDHRRLALRGDIDALPIDDQKSVDYRSRRPGIMHACGHDVHATVLLASLQILKSMQRSGDLPWPIAIRGVFQPAEETASGARHMIQHHALRDVEAILALHADPTRVVGRIGLRSGMLTASCDMVEVLFRGRGGHGARPHLCKDPIDACTRWVQTAYARLSRVLDPHETVVFSIGQIEAGHSPNVIPGTARLAGTLRSLDASNRRVALDTLEAISNGIADETGCHVEMRLGVSAPPVNNDPKLVQLLRDAAARVIDPAAVDPIDQPSMGSEDFSYYLEHVPGAMLRLGVAGSQVGREPLHTPLFDIDERAIAVGAKLFAAAAIGHFAPAVRPAGETSRPDGPHPDGSRLPGDNESIRRVKDDHGQA